MGSGSEDEDEENNGVVRQHPGALGVSHLGAHSMGLVGDQVIGPSGDLPLSSDLCKQEDSEDQGNTLSLLI